MRLPTPHWALFILVVINFFFLVLRFDLSSSFWLDETISMWIAQSPLLDVIGKTYLYQAQSPLYYLLLHGVIRFFGSAEFVARSLSLVAGCGCGLVLFALARKYMSYSAAVVTTLLLLVNGDFVSALLSARPYVFALLLSLASIFALLRYFEGSRSKWLCLSAFFSVATFYFHYLFFPSLALVLGLYFFKSRGVCRASSYQLMLIGLVAGIACLPGAWHLYSISLMASEYAFAAPLSAVLICKSVIAAEPAVLLIMTVLCVYFFASKAHRHFSFAGAVFPLHFLLWALIPPLTIIIFSLVTGHSLMVRRYFLLATPAHALIGGWIIDRFNSEKARYAAALLIGVSVLSLPRSWVREEWRDAIASVVSRSSQGAVTLLNSGLIEGESLPWLKTYKAVEYLSAPVQIYAPELTVIPISRAQTNELEEFERTELLPHVADKSVLLLISQLSPREYNSSDMPAIYPHYQQILSSSGYEFKSFEQFGLVAVGEFHRKSTTVE